MHRPRLGSPLRSAALAALSALFIASALASVTVSAHAEPSMSDKETARNFMSEGRDKRDKGDQKGALESFKSADAIMHVPTTGLEVGKTQAELGMLIEARDTLLAVARTAPQPGEPAAFEKARAEADALADSIAPRIPSIKLTVTGIPTGTTVTVAIDGVTIAGGYGGLRKINPGAHVIVASGGGAEKKMNADLAEGITKEISVDFSDAKPPTSTVKDDASSSTGTSSLVWIGFGVAGAGLVAGSVTGLMHLSKVSQIKDQCPNNKCPPSAYDTYDSAKTLSTISTVSFVVAGVGAAVGVFGLLSPPKASPPPASGAIRVTPFIGLGVVGVNGAF